MTFRSFAVAAFALALPAGASAPASLSAQTTDSTYLAGDGGHCLRTRSARAPNRPGRTSRTPRGPTGSRHARTRLDARINVQKADIDALKSRSDLAKRTRAGHHSADLELRRRRAEAVPQDAGGDQVAVQDPIVTEG